MLHPPPSAILETVAGSFLADALDDLDGLGNVREVHGGELGVDDCAVDGNFKRTTTSNSSFHISRRNRRENCRAQFLHAGLVASGATVLDINLHHRSVVSSCLL